MNNVTYFKKFEVIGRTKKEAIENSGLNLRVDATQAYKKFIENNAVNDDNLNEFLKSYLAKKHFDKANDGAYIVLQSHVLDTRERPYQVEKPKYDARTHTPVRMYVGRSQVTGDELFVVKTSKEADKAAKEWIIENRSGVDIFIETRMKENNSLYARVNYVASKGSKPCKILAFGYFPAD